MANVTYETTRHVPGQVAGMAVRRIVAVIGAGMAGLLEDLAAARRELRVRRATRGLSRHLLRDVGLDRSAC
jgi:NADPH-dependent 2,4-dienoyl-CoA reductase/sulfur reductase-like enzyme